MPFGAVGWGGGGAGLWLDQMGAVVCRRGALVPVPPTPRPLTLVRDVPLAAMIVEVLGAVHQLLLGLQGWTKAVSRGSDTGR